MEERISAANKKKTNKQKRHNLNHNRLLKYASVSYFKQIESKIN